MGCKQKQTHVIEEALEKQQFQEYFSQRMHELNQSQISRDSLNSTSAPISIVDQSLNRFGLDEVSVEIISDSLRTIDGLRLIIYFSNNFEEHIFDENNRNYIIGESQELIEPNVKKKLSWIIEGEFQKATKVKSFVKQVHFTDGSVWVADMSSEIN